MSSPLSAFRIHWFDAESETRPDTIYDADPFWLLMLRVCCYCHCYCYCLVVVPHLARSCILQHKFADPLDQVCKGRLLLRERAVPLVVLCARWIDEECTHRGLGRGLKLPSDQESRDRNRRCEGLGALVGLLCFAVAFLVGLLYTAKPLFVVIAGLCYLHLLPYMLCVMAKSTADGRISTLCRSIQKQPHSQYKYSNFVQALFCIGALRTSAVSGGHTKSAQKTCTRTGFHGSTKPSIPDSKA